MRKYINLIPLLKTQYEKEVTEESLVTEELLDEDKIPPDLLKAYRTNWQDRYNVSNEKKVGYGLDDSSKIVPNHSRLRSGNISRHSSEWDLGKAYFKKLSKQDAVSLLNMHIYSGKGRSAQEISINDPIPETLTVKCPDDTAAKNIYKLRFLLPGRSGELALTEYEYREDRNQFFPIYKQYFSSEVFDENNIEPFKEARMDYAPKGYSLIGVYYAIKFSKVIYETDEYDHPLTSKDATDFTRGSKTVDRISKNLANYLQIQFIHKWIKLISNEIKPLTFPNDSHEILNIVNEIDSDPAFNLNLNINSSAREWAESWFEIEKIVKGLSYSTSQLKMSFDSLISWNLENNDLQVYNRLYKPKFEAELKTLATLTDSESGILKDLALKIQSELFEHEFPEGRLKDVYRRRVVKSQSSYQRAKSQHGDDVHNPYTGWTSERKTGNITLNTDSGDHSYAGRKIKQYNRSYGTYDDVEMTETFRELSNDYINKVDLKKDYLKSLKALNQIKKQRDYFDSDEEFIQRFTSIYDDYKQRKSSYENILKQIKSKEKIFLNLSDEMMQSTLRKIQKYYIFLQDQHKKMLVSKELLKDILTYTEEDFYTIFGNNSEAKKLFNELQSKIDGFIDENKKYNDLIQEKKSKIDELKAQIAELESEMESDKQTINDNEAEITKLQDQQNSLDLNIDQLIAKAYEKQQEQADELNKIENDVNRMKLSVLGKDKSKVKTQSSKELDSRVTDLLSFIPFNEKPEIEMPDEDSIFADDED